MSLAVGEVSRSDFRMSVRHAGERNISHQISRCRTPQFAFLYKLLEFRHSVDLKFGQVSRVEIFAHSGWKGGIETRLELVL